MPSFACTTCGYRFEIWQARCPECNGWSVKSAADSAPITKVARDRMTITRRDAADDDLDPIDKSPPVTPLALPVTSIAVTDEESRYATTLPAFDYLLGGGFVPSSSVLIGGEPGAGKSTLILQALAGCARWNEARGLYVTGEETQAKIALRAQRVDALYQDLFIVEATDPDEIIRSAEQLEPEIIVVDSISVLARSDVDALPGSVTQVKLCAEALCTWCREHKICLILVGHVVKDGGVAGPATLKHLVDTVLHLEIVEDSQVRILRAHKNRDASTARAGRFMMDENGILRSIGDYKGYEPIERQTEDTKEDKLSDITS